MEDNKNAVSTEPTEVKEEVKADEVATKGDPAPEKTFTQAEVDELIQKRIAREAKKYEKKLSEATKPTEEQTSLEDENKTLKESIASLNKQILSYEAAKIATTLHVKPERVDAFLRLADLSSIELDDKGTYKDEIKEALEGVAKDFPEFLTDTVQKEKGEIKIGTEPKKEVDSAEELKQQIYKGLGLQ